MQDLPDAVTVFLEIGEQSIDAGRRHADQIHRLGQFFQSVQRDLLESSMGVVLLRERLDHRRNAGDLQASEIAKTIILVVNGKADVTVLFQSDELSPAFREHLELAVIENRHSPTLIVATVTTRTEKKKK